MASVYTEIRKVFEERLASVAGTTAIAWENVSFDPTTTQSYFRPRLIPVQRTPAVRGIDPQMYYRGYYQIDVCVPEGVGPNLADELADLLIDEFEGATDITDGTLNIPLEYAERDLGIKDGAYYIVPVRIGWFLYLSN